MINLVFNLFHDASPQDIQLDIHHVLYVTLRIFIYYSLGLLVAISISPIIIFVTQIACKMNITKL